MVLFKLLRYNSSMRKETFLLIVGTAVFITPFLGLPQSWIAIYLYVLGSFIVLIAISCRIQARRRGRRHAHGNLHIENKPTSDDNE